VVITKEKLRRVAHQVKELTKDDRIAQAARLLRVSKPKPAWKRPRNYFMAIFGLGATLIMFKNTITGMFKPAKTDTTTANEISRD
jgi:hypothetical protein